MYKLKNVAKRGSALLGAVGLLAGIGTSALPAFASADSLNPLTKRSLTLSSSSPGWAYTDGSGNTLYAPPNSGANGQKTGNTFAFHNSTPNGHVQTMSFQYCTKSAGGCWAPGDNTTPGAVNDTASTSDLNYVAGTGLNSPAEVSGTTTGLTDTITVTSGSTTVVGGSGALFTTELAVGDSFITAGGHSYVVSAIANATHLTISTTPTTTETGVTFAKSNFATVVDTQTGSVKAVPGVTDPLNTAGHPITTGQYAAHAVPGNFLVMYDNAGVWTQSTGWSMSVTNVEDPDDSGNGNVARGTNNYIILSNSTQLDVPFDTPMQVFFFGTTNNYLTNPGSGAFFVKINTYNVEYDGTTVTTSDLEPSTDDNVIDGGVTVANVMNQSIQITTKVLETMQFSVGTVDPDTLSSDRGANPMSPLEEAQYASAPASRVKHTPCDGILMRKTFGDPANVLQLGDQSSESSLAVEHTYSTHSYWRLSSNSSAGATVYYSGHTLSNTENDQIDPIGPTASAPAAGSEQFGLALDNGTDGAGGTHAVNYAQEATYENGQDNGLTAIDTAGLTTDNVTSNGSWHTPKLQPLDPTSNYGGGTGGINGTINTTFAFDANSDTIPTAIASENSQVVDCVTGKMRYIANIAATTPAGIYTTKINYIAAPQY